MLPVLLSLPASVDEASELDADVSAVSLSPLAVAARRREDAGGHDAPDRHASPWHIDINHTWHQNASMRTTIVLDDGVARKLKALALKRGVSFRAVVDETLRRGLSAQDPREARRTRYRVATFRSAFRPGVDPQRLNQLVDELDADSSHQRTAR